MNAVYVNPRKAWSLLRVFILHWFLGLASIGLVKGYTQDLLDRPVTLRLENSTLPSVLRELEAVAQVKFTYIPQLVDQRKTLSLQAKNEPLALVLDRLLKPLRISYQVTGSYIILNRMSLQRLGGSSVKAPSLESVHPLDRPISGTVKDETGAGIPGITVRVKGTPMGTTTNEKGAFSLRIPQENAVLVFSSVGFLSQEVSVGNLTVIEAVLKADTKSLNEVLVVGYGTQKKVNLTGSVDMVTSQELASRPLTNTSSALQGLMPGLTVVNSNPMPGQSGNTIRIRGIGTLGNANPLILIDGIEASMDNINPDDIESVSVLKDASSAAIYGSRGANGVILVTTKKGKQDAKPSIGYSGYIGVQQPTRLPEFLGSVDYMKYLNEALVNVGRPPSYTDEEIATAANGTDPNYYANTSWIREMYRRSAPQQNHNVNINGGSGALNYYLSYGHLSQQGLIVGNALGAKRNNVRLRLSTEVLDRLQLDANLGYVDRTYEEPAADIAAGSGPIYSAHTISPLIPVRFTNGSWGYGGGSTNPVAVAHDGGLNKFASQEFTGNFSATLKLAKGLSIRGQYGTVMSNSKRDIFNNKITYYYPETGDYWYASAVYNSLSARDYVNRYQSIITQADYEAQWGKHNLHWLAGYSQEWNRADNMIAGRQNFLSNGVVVLNGGTVNPTNSGDASHWALRSGFSRVNYVLADKYLLEANVRYDGSSRFSKSNRFGAFPSLSAGWRISEESFMQPLKTVIHDLKLRASWGRLGNQYVNSSLYPYISSIGSVSTMPIGNILTPAFAATQLANANLTWEKVTMTNLGLDLQLFRGKLAATLDVFDKKTSDILLIVRLPDVLGIDEPEQNAGAVRNRGWELGLNWKDQIGSVKYGIQANLSDVKNEVTSLGGLPPTYGDRIRILGSPIDAFYGLVADGIAQESDFTRNEATGKLVPEFPIISGDVNFIKPGDVKYRDLNGDGQITLDGDRKVIGNAFPRYTFSLRPTLAWKGLDFSFFIQGVGKADGYVQGSARHAYISESAYPQKSHLDHWTPENTDAKYPRFTYQQSHNQRFSSYWLENASYVRLKNVQLGYSFPQNWLKNARIERVRFYVSADNLLTATSFFHSYDPETPVTSGGFYPQVKTIIGGLNISLR